MESKNVEDLHEKISEITAILDQYVHDPEGYYQIITLLSVVQSLLSHYRREAR